jgi:Spy/CpxP family protein refolding chaperone
MKIVQTIAIIAASGFLLFAASAQADPMPMKPKMMHHHMMHHHYHHHHHMMHHHMMKKPM